MIRPQNNASLKLGVENGPVLNSGLDSDLGILLSVFRTVVAAAP